MNCLKLPVNKIKKKKKKRKRKKKKEQQNAPYAFRMHNDLSNFKPNVKRTVWS
jgi:hypothetical protein